MARKYFWLGIVGEADSWLQCDRACYGAEIHHPWYHTPHDTRFNVTAPVMARKYCHRASIPAQYGASM